jgi:hypothetical protein
MEKLLYEVLKYVPVVIVIIFILFFCLNFYFWFMLRSIEKSISNIKNERLSLGGSNYEDDLRSLISRLKHLKVSAESLIRSYRKWKKYLFKFLNQKKKSRFECLPVQIGGIIDQYKTQIAFSFKLRNQAS